MTPALTRMQGPISALLEKSAVQHREAFEVEGRCSQRQQPKFPSHKPPAEAARFWIRRKLKSAI
jgi:hypothetical protein